MFSHISGKKWKGKIGEKNTGEEKIRDEKIRKEKLERKILKRKELERKNWRGKISFYHFYPRILLHFFGQNLVISAIVYRTAVIR